MTDRTRVDELVLQLTLEEKALLTAGEDLWSTVAVERLGIPKVRVTDGPNGARGPVVPGVGGLTSACVPCGSALGATWNPELVERIGALLGAEARTKGCRVLLAPTVNLHRSPLAGRNFECYSEDPLLSGRTAAAFIRGAQAQGVATTVKHFAGNDAEFERQTINSVIDERTLRELYLVPFELAVREGGSLGIMTAYNRLNGPYCTESATLLRDVLRGEWGFEGFVLTDWFGNGSTAAAATAGLDLEMPGPGRFYGPALAEAVQRGDVDEALVDAAAGRLLAVFARIGALDAPSDATATAIDRPEHRALAREAATESIVLLRNDGVLPIEPAAVARVAVVGPNAARTQIMGGGSASLVPHYRVNVLDALRDRFGDGVEIVHERGCTIDRTVPPLGGPALVTPDGEPGLALEYFAGHDLTGEPAGRGRATTSRLLFLGAPDASVPADTFAVRATGRFTPAESGTYTFTLVQAGRARLLVDGAVALDGSREPPPPGDEFFGLGSQELETTLDLAGGAALELVVEYWNEATVGLGGVKIGCAIPSPPDLLERAVTAAANADLAIVVVGTNDDWESEGHDRQSMDLPGEQDELITRVAAANPNTVVVVNTGSPVTMDWCEQPAAVLQAWFGGQEAGNAIADVLVGAAEPGGRLPTTFPVRIEDNPSFGNFPGEFGEVRYGEGLLMGYRGYEARRQTVRFPFGYGLSYTTFTIDEPRLSSATIAAGDAITVDVPVTNTGERCGSEVVQCYVAPIAPAVHRPPKELKTFAKVHLEPGESTTASMALDARAFSSWSPSAHDWQVDAGTYELHVGRSSADIDHVVRVEVAG